jgi:hypothetical protein
VSFDASLWELPTIDVHCSREKDLLAFYPDDNPGTKSVSAGCSFITAQMHLGRSQTILRHRLFAWSMTVGYALEEVELGSSDHRIPAHGSIKGDLFPGHECDRI